MAAPDTLASLVAYLKTVSEVNTPVGGRVYGIKVPTSQAKNMPAQPCLVLGLAGGFGPLGGGVLHQRIDAKSYAKSGQEANQIHSEVIRALDSLNNNTAGGAFLYSAELESGPSYNEEPAPAFWPFILSTWSITTNLIGVSE